MHGWLVTSVLLVSTIRYDDDNSGAVVRRPPARRSENEVLGESSRVTSSLGHWPSSYCRVTNVYLSSADNTFVINGHEQAIDICYGTRQIWSFKGRGPNAVGAAVKCDQLFDTGHVFTIYYHNGSNYFHLHYDTTLPIYSTFYHRRNHSSMSTNQIVLMPSVEQQRGQGTDWSTQAFMNDSSYWIELLKAFSGGYKMLPLDKRLMAIKKTFCFKEIYFGTPKFNASSSEMLSGYSNLIKERVKVRSTSALSSKLKKIGLIHRSGRRKILNENELLKSVIPLADVELIDFKGLKFKNQVAIVQNYSVLVGMNGAGLINALYLPPNSVAIQMVPYAAQLNYKEYGQLLEARGPYIEWHNVHKNKSVPVPGDPSHSNDNTVIDVGEFVELIKKALIMCEVQ